MTYDVYTVRDKLVGFGPLIVEPNRNVAIRNFTKLSSVPDIPFSDYEFYFLGTYDTVTGVVTGFAVPEFVCRGSDFVNGSDHNETC